MSVIELTSLIVLIIVAIGLASFALIRVENLRAQLTSPTFRESLKGDTGPMGLKGDRGDPGTITEHIIYNGKELTADDIVTALSKSDEITLKSTKISAKGFYKI